MAYHNLPMTGSGVTDCARGCGEHVMTSDLSKPAYCDDENCADEIDEENEVCDECGCSQNEFSTDCECPSPGCPANCYRP